MRTGNQRRTANVTCAIVKGAEGCRAIARWRCPSCDANACAAHAARSDFMLMCPHCDGPLTPLMQRTGDRRRS